MLSDEFEGFHAEQLKLMPAPVSVIYISDMGNGFDCGYVLRLDLQNGIGFGYRDGYGLNKSVYTMPFRKNNEF
jgi:hypothetical protein